MKGLLLKDFYMMKKYCRSYLLIAVIFITVSFFSDDNLFFAFYPCLFCGMIPVNLLAYDEQSRFVSYAGTLPYTKAQIVSGKYIIGLISQLSMITVIGIAQAVKMGMEGTLFAQEYLAFIMMIFCASAIVPSLCLPLIFKFGTEKGRMIYFLMIGVVFAMAYAFSSVLEKVNMTDNINLGGALPFLCAIGVVIYALSWYLSIVFYRKREI